MKNRYSILALLILTKFTFGQDINSQTGAKSAGLGMTGVCLTDIWSTTNNQAGLAFIEKSGIGFDYESRFNIKELAQKDVVAALKTNFGTFGLSIAYFGDNKYNESKFGLAYSKKLFNSFSIGVQINYLETRIGENYGNSGIFNSEIGFYSRLTKDLTFAGHIANVPTAKVDINTNRAPMKVKLGIVDKITENIEASGEVQKIKDISPSMHIGIDYHLVKPIFIRIGFLSNPNSFMLGIGFKYSEMTLDIASVFHPVLGMSNQVSLNWNF